jgi:N-acetylmuramoyl-L-alanine amidase
MQTGWLNNNGTWYYLNSSGSMQTGWLAYGGTWYYLNSEGKMQTNWYQVNGTWYYSDETGAMQTGWLNDRGTWYYLNSSGAMQTGWITVGGKEYYMKANGAWNPYPVDLEGRVIVIDPGHGGKDTGAVSDGIYEKNLNLSVSLKLRELLSAHGATVYMTRDTDVFIPLYDRPSYSNTIKPHAFISIHTNASTSSAAIGIETYYNSERGWKPEESKKLANAIQSELIKATGGTNKGVKSADFAVIRENSAASVLVEMGFITNETERANLINSSYQDKIVKGIYNGLYTYFH